MNNRTMVKIYETDDSYSIKTVSRGFKSPHRFIILKEVFDKLEQQGSVIVNDMNSYARLILVKNQEGQKILQIHFTWIEASEDMIQNGRKEIIRLPYAIFREPVFNELCSGQDKKILSIQSDGKKPEIVFKSRSHLREVVNRPILRSKLVRFLDNHFNWIESQYIVITDDCEPYSFGFTEYTERGLGICGGIILHGRENLKTSYYGIHT